jgi:hypothetical protein
VQAAFSIEQVKKTELFKQLGYDPHASQWEYHNSKARFRCAVCGRRFGKSTMAAMDRIADLFVPNRMGWIVGPTYDLASKEFKVMWEKLITKKGLGLIDDKRVKKNFNLNSGDMFIEMPWGARVDCRSATKPDSLVGEGLHWLILSEAAKQHKETWERSLRATLSDHRGGADLVTTPEGKNWVYDFYKLGRREDHPDYWSSRLPSWMNTHVFPGGRNDPEIKLIEETTLEEWFMQEYGAEFSALVGRIYGEFSEEDHVLTQSYEFNPDWPNYITFDWGFAAPLAAMEFQVDPRTGAIYVWREHYETQRTLEWHIETIKDRYNPPGYRLDGGFGDAADPEAVEYVSQHLVHVEADPDSKLWLSGVRLMKGKLKLTHDGIAFDENLMPIMRPSYFIDPSCENHIEEMLAYRVKRGAVANEFKGVGVVDPKSSDHTLDAMRYGLMHLFSVGVQHHLEEVRPTWAKTMREQASISSPQKELALTANGLHNSRTFFNMRRMAGSRRF